MSHWTCEHCGGRFRDEHTCDQDPEVVTSEIMDLKVQVASLTEMMSVALNRIARLEAAQRQGDEL